jgi:hypothetical protein
LGGYWAASDANDFELEHQVYREEAVLGHPRSGERIRTRRHIRAARAGRPKSKRFTARRIEGAGDVWVTEFMLACGGRPAFAVSVTEFLDGKVGRETQCFADPFEPRRSRAE